MTRNEVLERLDAAGSDRGPIVYELVHVGLLRAAAELIRAGGWRPIAEAPEGGVALWVGSWEKMADGSEVFISWDEQQFKRDAIVIGYTHYLPKPDPPAREVENG